MAYNIRPLSFAEILDRSLRILVDNAVVLIGISAIVWVPERVFLSLGKGFQVITVILLIAVVPLFQAAITTAVAEIYLDRPVTIAGAYRSAWAILLPFVGTYLLLYSMFLMAGIVYGVIVALGSVAGLGLPLAIILGVLVGLPLGLYWNTRWSLIGPVMIVERRFGLAALRRSRDLVEGAWWRTFGIIIVAALISQVPVGALNLLWSSIPVLGVLLSGVGAAISSAYSVIAIVVYYFDRRCRIEDFDLLLLAEQIRSQGAHDSPAASGAPSLV